MHYALMYRSWSGNLHIRALYMYMYIRIYWMKYKEILLRFQKESNILHTKKWTANLINHTLRMNCTMQLVT
jgi:hypothetical protein